MTARSNRRRLRLLLLAPLGALALDAAASCAKDDPSGGVTTTRDASALDPARKGIDDAGASAATTPGQGEALDAAGCHDGDCAPGYLCCAPCCVAGRPPVCLRAVGGKCPLPDLSVNEGALATTVALDMVDAGPCELEEKCLTGTGARRVLRFDARIKNGGAVNLELGAPDASAGFIWAPCHGHYHFDGFATYALRDQQGNAIVIGRKQAFCARDSYRFDKNATFSARYDCTNQGIQVGWEDSYPAELPCQYLDVTDVPKGTYWLEVDVNPTRTITELDYDNNSARVKVELP